MISICIKDNNIDLQDFLIKEINKSSIKDIYYSKHSFKIYKNLIVHYIGDDLDSFFNFLAKILSMSQKKYKD